MAEAEQPQDAAPKKKSKLPLILGLVLFLVLGGGGFYAVYSGLILGHPAAEGHAEAPASALPAIAFVPLDPVTITLGEVAAEHSSEVRSPARGQRLRWRQRSSCCCRASLTC